MSKKTFTGNGSAKLLAIALAALLFLASAAGCGQQGQTPAGAGSTAATGAASLGEATGGSAGEAGEAAPSGNAAEPAAGSASESPEPEQPAPEQEATAQQAAQGAGNGGTGEGQAPQPVTLTAFIDAPNAIEGWKWGDDAVSNGIMEKTGVTLEITNASTSDHQELSTALASGDFLADFIIVNPYSTMPHMIISQGFAAPLNELADAHASEFWDVLPADENTVLNWDDGNLYYVVDQFGDAERRDELKEPFSPQTSFVIDGFAYEEMGSPDISTLEALKDALKQAREKFGTSFALYDGRIAEASSDSSMGQTINRLMGGQNLCSIQPDGTVRLNFQDEEYYRAAKYINSLYLDGTFNPENFTITSEQFKQLLEERQIFAYIGHNWAILSGYEGGLDEGAPYQLWDYPIAEGVDPKDVKLMDSYGNVGVNYATFINADTEYPDRAIGYMAFMLSDAGQIMVREGIDGLTYTLDGEGIPHPTELRREYERGPVDKLTKELGMNNAKFAWFTSNWAYSLARHLRIENEQPYYGPSLWTAKPYASWERLNVLSGIIVDTDLLAIRTQIFTLWNNALPSLYLAKTDAEFDAAYQKLISDARLLGLDTLESAYAANYKKYYDRGIR